MKVRILYVITRLTVGGDTNVLLDMAEHFGRGHADFEAHVAAGPVPASEVDLTERARARGIAVTIVPHLVNRLRPLDNIRAFLELRSLIRRGAYTIVHTHSSVAGVVGRLAAFAAGVPVVVHHVHGWGLRPDMHRPMRVLYVGLERLCARRTSAIVAVSRETVIKGVSLGIPESRMTLLYNGIDVARFSAHVDGRQARRALGLPRDARVVSMIGRLDAQKNPLDFIRAARLVADTCPTAHFVLAGDGALRAECEQLVETLGLQGAVHLLGFRDDVERILAASTVVALSSLWEGLPVVFQEAMCVGRPIVANDVDGARDVVKDGVTGYLVPPRDPGAMAGRIAALLNDAPLRRAMGAAARANAASFSREHMLARLDDLYRAHVRAVLNREPLPAPRLQPGGVR